MIANWQRRRKLSHFCNIPVLKFKETKISTTEKLVLGLYLRWGPNRKKRWVNKSKAAARKNNLDHFLNAQSEKNWRETAFKPRDPTFYRKFSTKKESLHKLPFFPSFLPPSSKTSLTLKIPKNDIQSTKPSFYFSSFSFSKKYFF